MHGSKERVRTTKRCIGCGQVKKLDEFHHHSQTSDGRQTRCKPCTALYKSEYRDRRRETKRATDQSYYQRNRESQDAAKKRWAEKNPHKILAGNKLTWAVKKGDIVKPTECEKCGTDERQIQAHHPDYSKPLDVQWLCTRCHGEAHRRIAEDADVVQLALNAEREQIAEELEARADEVEHMGRERSRDPEVTARTFREAASLIRSRSEGDT